MSLTITSGSACKRWPCTRVLTPGLDHGTRGQLTSSVVGETGGRPTIVVTLNGAHGLHVPFLTHSLVHNGRGFLGGVDAGPAFPCQ